MTESALERMIAIFDVEPAGPGLVRFSGDSDGGGRPVVDGSQILAQSLVAASKALPGRTLRHAHALFVCAADPAKPLEFTVTPVRAGRSFASAMVTVRQGDRTCTTGTVLLDYPQPDVIRHDRWPGPRPPAPAPRPPPHSPFTFPPSPARLTGPEAAHPADLPMRGRQVRIEGVREHNSPDEVGPPVMDAWLHYDTLPRRDDLRRALLAHFTGHLSVSTTMRAHPGIGTSQAHHTVSTAVMAIGVSFHDSVRWDGWIRYHHESTYAGAGMSYVRGQVLTGEGRLVMSFTQDAMIRAMEPGGPATSVPAGSRL
jgi:acyl-CoA thioesterase II